VQVNETVGAYDSDIELDGRARGNAYGSPRRASGRSPMCSRRSIEAVCSTRQRTSPRSRSSTCVQTSVQTFTSRGGAWTSGLALDATNGRTRNHVIRGSGTSTGAALTAQAFTDDGSLAGCDRRPTSRRRRSNKRSGPTSQPTSTTAVTQMQALPTLTLTTELLITDPRLPDCRAVDADLTAHRRRWVRSRRTSSQCQLKPFDAVSADYGSVVFTRRTDHAIARWSSRMGVCDWTKAGSGAGRRNGCRPAL